MARQEGDGGIQLGLRGRGNRKGDEVVQNAGRGQMGHDQQIAARQERRKDVLGHHHLRPGEARVQLRRAEDMVLGGVREAVQEQVDRKEEDSPRARARLTLCS